MPHSYVYLVLSGHVQFMYLSSHIVGAFLTALSNLSPMVVFDPLQWAYSNAFGMQDCYSRSRGPGFEITLESYCDPYS